MSATNFVLLVMYDMPSVEKVDQKAYRLLVRYLIKSGFYALQGSIYLKPLPEKAKAKNYIAEIKKLGVVGSHIRALVLTHQAFLSMETVIGSDTWGERLIKQPESVISL